MIRGTARPMGIPPQTANFLVDSMDVKRMWPNHSDPAIDSRWKWAIEIIREAGKITLDYFGKPDIGLERKSDDSPVTVADREAESLLRTRIREKFPEDAVLGEEFGAIEGNSGFRWILDPIDGTKTFITGVPLYSTLIGIELRGVCVIGLIAIPALGELVHAASGAGAWHCQPSGSIAKAKVSARDELGDAIFITSQVDSFAKRNAPFVFEELQRRAYVTRTWGDGYGYLLVATGRADVIVDPAMNLWDAAALKPVLDEAGGFFGDWKGIPRIDGGEGVAVNQLLRDEVIAITSKG